MRLPQETEQTATSSLLTTHDECSKPEFHIWVPLRTFALAVRDVVRNKSKGAISAGQKQTGPAHSE